MTPHRRPRAPAGRGRQAGADSAGGVRAAAFHGGEDHAGDLARLLPELAVALYQAAPHGVHARAAGPEATPLTGRQMEAVVFLAHRGRVTMGEFADGLEIGRAAASELVTRLLEKEVVRREDDPVDRRVVYVSLAGRAEGYADELLSRWRGRLATVFARYPGIDPDTLVAFLRDVVRELKGRP